MLLSLVRGDPAFSMLRPVHGWMWQSKGGRPVDKPWEEAEFTLVDSAVDEFVAADCLTMNTGADGFIVSDYAREILTPMLTEADQFWPVRVLGIRYWWLNCVALVEALDRGKTDADWSVVEGEWGSFRWISTTRRLAFKPGRLEHAPVLFRVPEYPQGVLFAQEAFRYAVKEHELTGFRFDTVWSSGEGGVFDSAGIGFGRMFDVGPQNEMELKRQMVRDTLARRLTKLGRRS